MKLRSEHIAHSQNMDTQIFKAQKAQKTTERHAYADFCFEQCDICQSRPVLVAGCAVVCL